MAFEVGLIVLGVLAGLAVDNWRQDVAERDRAREVLALVAAELARNRESFSSILPYHESLRDSLTVLTTDATRGKPLAYSDFDRAAPRGFEPRLASVTAWSLAQNAGILSHLDLEVLQAVSTAYQHQDFLNGKLNRLEANLYEAANQDPSHFVGLAVSLRWLVGDIVIQERSLVERTIPEALRTLRRTGIVPRDGRRSSHRAGPAAPPSSQPR